MNKQRCFLGVFFVLMIFLSGCATHLKGDIAERGFIKLETVDFGVSDAKFEVPPDEVEFYKLSGMSNGAFVREVYRVFESVLIANEIEISSDKHKLAPYKIQVLPINYKVVTRGSKFRSVELKITLTRTEGGGVLWSGSRWVDLQDQSKNYKITTNQIGNLALASLNGMHSEGVIVLPRSHAVTPRGGSNYSRDY